MGGSVYAFAGGKGGVGKTTTTANVAVALSETGYDVAAVDADIGMTNLGEFLGIERSVGIHEVLAGSADLADVVVEGPGDVGVVPGGDDPTGAAEADPSNLREVVDPLREVADVVLLDTGAGISHQNLVAYGLSDAVALVTTVDHVAVGDADKTAELAERVECPVVGTVVTRVHADTDLETLAGRLDDDVVAAIPEYERPDAPEPRVLVDPDCPAAAEYRRLATTIAVCHQTDDLRTAAKEASDRVRLPEPDETLPEPEEAAVESGVEGMVAGLLSRFPFGR